MIVDELNVEMYQVYISHRKCLFCFLNVHPSSRSIMDMYRERMDMYRENAMDWNDNAMLGKKSERYLHFFLAQSHSR